MPDKEVLNKPPNLVIVNTRAGAINLPDWKQPKDGKPAREDPSPEEGITLLPGENNCPADYWDYCKTQRTVQMYMAEGFIKNKGEGIARSLADGLDALERHEANARIAKCKEPRILKDWADKTTDKGLRNRCLKRIDEALAEQRDA